MEVVAIVLEAVWMKGGERSRGNIIFHELLDAVAVAVAVVVAVAAAPKLEVSRDGRGK